MKLPGILDNFFSWCASLFLRPFFFPLVVMLGLFGRLEAPGVDLPAIHKEPLVWVGTILVRAVIAPPMIVIMGLFGTIRA